MLAAIPQSSEVVIALLIEQHPKEIIRQFPYELLFAHLTPDADELLEICLN